MEEGDNKKTQKTKPEKEKSEGVKPKKAEDSGVGSTEKKKSRTAKMMVIGLVTALAVGLLGVTLVLTFGIYWLGWQGPTARKAIDTIPYPAATVNGETVLYSEYLDDLDTLKRFYENQKEQGMSAEDMPSEDEFRSNAMERLIFTTVLEQEAENRGITVSQEEIDAEYDKLAEQSGGESAMEAELQATYGWSPEKFKKKVLGSYLLQTKLAESLAEDDELNSDTMDTIAEIQQKLEEGEEEFEALAVEYSDDPSVKTNKGDLGWFGKGTMVPAFEDAVFALDIGEISDPVKTQFGYHLIKLDDVKEEEGEVSEAKAHHILIKTVSVEEYIESKIQEAEVTKYVGE